MKCSFLFLFLLLLPLASAHLDGGEDVSKDGYVLDFGYTPAEPRARSSTSFALNVVNETTREPAGMTAVWMRISSDDDVFFSGVIATPNGRASFTYTFPKADTYEVDVRPMAGDRQLTEASFTIDIHQGFPFARAGVVILIILLAIIAWWRLKT